MLHMSNLFSRSGKKNTLRLRYEKDDQIDSRVTDPSNDVSWGVSVITWGALRIMVEVCGCAVF